MFNGSTVFIIIYHMYNISVITQENEYKNEKKVEDTGFTTPGARLAILLPSHFTISQKVIV